jgi:hypothetical protein
VTLDNTIISALPRKGKTSLPALATSRVRVLPAWGCGVFFHLFCGGGGGGGGGGGYQ